MEDKARVWTARILAPIAFLAAATLLVVLVQRALRDNGGSGAVTSQTPTVEVSTEEVETGTTASSEEQFYRIKAGDTLEAIAQQFDTTVEVLLELNQGIDPLGLTPGQRIRVS